MPSPLHQQQVFRLQSIGAREKLAKASGILLAYRGLKIQLEGHTDSIGSDDSVLEYLPQ
jgi:outer membrane protein OmpA-like peptidoglycan-associated protein